MQHLTASTAMQVPARSVRSRVPIRSSHLIESAVRDSASARVVVAALALGHKAPQRSPALRADTAVE